MAFNVGHQLGPRGDLPAGRPPAPPAIYDSNGIGIHYSRLGVLIYGGPGGISLDWYSGLIKLAAKTIPGRKHVLHAGIAYACEAHTAITTLAKQVEWMASMGLGANQPDWLKSCDTGTSSLTIFATLKSRPDALRGSRPAIPRDADDFGRCHRLVTMWHPELRSELHVLADVHPNWAPIVAEWDSLAALAAAGNAAELNVAIKKASGEEP